MPKEVKEEKKKKLSTGWIVAIVILVLLIMAVSWLVGTRNSLVRLDTSVDTAWSNVQVQYQRRADLIPNLVATVKGAANFEQSTLTQITEARSRWTAAQSQGPEAQVAAASQLEGEIGRFINVVVENYPTLTATQNFKDLQAQLEGTENRVSVERQRYNTAVQGFNTQVRLFPTNIVAGMFGFKQRTFFNAAPGAENAPPVVF